MEKRRSKGRVPEPTSTPSTSYSLPGLQLSLLSITPVCWKNKICTPRPAELAPISHVGRHRATG